MLIRHCRQHHRPRAIQELEFFRQMPSLERALLHAARAIDRRCKRFDHQRRHSQATLIRAHQAHGRSVYELSEAEPFDELMVSIAKVINPIGRLRELYIYDTAVRLGAIYKAQLAPALVVPNDV